jgi:hypothetical protein
MKLNKVAWPVLVMALSAPMLFDCSAKDLKELAEGCDEMNGGATAVASLNVDGKVKGFIQAAVDLQDVAVSMQASVKTACINIATGLGATDTWSSLSGTAVLANSDGTGACDKASAAIKAALAASGDAGVAATIQLVVSGGQCTVAADVQAQCEGSCQANVSCTEPALTARCTPGEITGQCDAACNASATCEGSLAVAANCEGTCAAECSGTCSGSCEGTITGGCTGTCEGTCDGTATPAGGQANCAGTCEGKCSAPAATATCKGSCAATCKGTCTGNCKLAATANVTCGAQVNCKGGCSVAYTAPKCEVALTPPTCEGDASCQASCSGRAEVKASCSQPTVKVVVSGNATGLATLTTVLETNMPAIWSAFKTQGALAAKGAGKLVAAGTGVISVAGTFGGKAVACVASAVSVAGSATASVNVSVSASASVSSSTGS